MKERVLHREQQLDVGIEQAFGFFSRAENLEAITPPWLGFRITSPAPIEMGVGTLIEYRLRLHGVPVRWLTRIQEWDPPQRFVDQQLRGPYAVWHHTHSFGPLDDGHTLMTDRVRYAQRLGPLGTAAEHLIVKRDLARIFDYRHEAIARLISGTAGAATEAEPHGSS